MKSTEDSLPKPGKITALKQQVKNHARTSVFIDGEFAFGIWTDLVLENELHVGKELDEAQLNALLDVERVRRGQSTALQYLAYAARSEHQLRERLRQGGYSSQEITRIIQNLDDMGYIDDYKYAMEYARARFKNKGYGPERIRQELTVDGISQEYISRAVAACADPDTFVACASQLAERYLGRVQGTLPERKKKLIHYLVRRGYDYGTAKESVQEVLNRNEVSKRGA